MNNIITQEEKNKIDALCKKIKIRNYTINGDGSIDVNGNAIMAFHYFDEKTLPIKFNRVSGDFNCSNNKLTSLVGCPVEVGGSFDCRENALTSLEGCPKKVGENFDCEANRLNSLLGCPLNIIGFFDCSSNKLTSLVGCPTVVGGHFQCSNNILPREIIEALEYTKLLNTEEQDIFLKYQAYFNVWTPEFNEEGMNELIAEIKDGLL
jgi:hypothetical protein